jgi:uncharacterized membrane protein
MAKHSLEVVRRRHVAGKAHELNANILHDEFKVSLGFNARVASVLTAIYGSMYFVYFLALGCVLWIELQVMMGRYAFDPVPFALLLLIGNFIQLFGGPIIQVGQNLSAAHSELRAEADYHVNQESFARLEAIAQQIENLQSETLRQTKILEKLMRKAMGESQ